MTLAEQLSWVIALAGIVLAASTVVVLRRPSLALAVLLDLLLAAGLLRLDADNAWSTIAIAAGVIALRHLVTYGLGAIRATAIPERPA